MKRLVTLALLTLALAAVPVALADGGTGTTTTTATTPAPTTVNAPRVGLRLDILRIRLRLVRLELRLHCGPRSGDTSAQSCTGFVQTVEQKVATLDSNVEQAIATLQACTSASTDPKCKNADKKIAVLQRIDTRLQAIEQKLQGRLAGGSSSSSSGGSTTNDSGLDQAANSLGQLAGAGGNG